MAISTNDPRLDQDRLIDSTESPTEYERNPNGEIKFSGQQDPTSRLSINLVRPVYDRDQLRKVIDRDISQLADPNDDPNNQSTNTITIE